MPPFRFLAPLAAACALVAGCGGDDRPADAGERPTVVATTGFAADLVRGVAGDAAQVVQLVPDSANPHTYAPSARDRATLEQADLVVAIGRNYEESLPLDDLSAPRLEIAEHAGRRDPAAADPHAEEEAGHGHAAGPNDPHVWMDPSRFAAAAAPLAAALARIDPSRADAYRRRGREQSQRLRALDAELRRILASVPAEHRKLVTSHESMGWFADRYGFEFVGAPFGLSPEAQASAQDIDRVIEQVRAEDVPAVFAQQGDDPKVMRRIAEEAGVRVVDDLLVENPGPQARTYADAMRHNARLIAEALGR